MGLAGPRRLSTRNCRYGRAVIEKAANRPPMQNFLELLIEASASPEIQMGPQTAEPPRNEGSRRFKSPFTANQSFSLCRVSASRTDTILATLPDLASG
jgi:hypothetical protein